MFFKVLMSIIMVFGFLAFDARAEDPQAVSRSSLAEDAAKTPAPNRIEEEREAEQELEKKFGTDVERSSVDRAGETQVVRDRVGEGKVGVFYDHEKDTRIQDDQDAIGVDVKILEFQ